MSSFVADIFSPEFIGPLCGVIALMIPIVAILVKHQQKMAEILHRATPNAEVEAMRREIADLRALVHQQTIQIDSLKGLGPVGTPQITARIEE